MKNSTLCYIEKDSSYLMLHRIVKKNDINRDKWIGIGGHFEENESPEECIKREALEETGLTLKNLRYRGIVTFVSNTVEGEYMHLFTSTDFEGVLSDCDEGVLEWVKKKDVPGLNLWEGDLIFFSLLEKDIPFFSLKLTYENDTLISAILNGEVKLK